MRIQDVFPVLIFAAGWASDLFAQPAPIAHFDFDRIRIERRPAELVRGETYVPKEVFAYVEEQKAGQEYDLNGKYYLEVSGVKEKAVLLDGYTAYIEIEGWNDEEEEENEHFPEVEDAFTISGWVALGAYPKNDCPVWDHRRPVSDGYTNGYSLEIDALGRPFLNVATRGKIERAMSPHTIPLNEWTHLAATYDKKNGLTVYVNGEARANTLPIGTFQPTGAEETSILIGRSRERYRPFGTIRPEGTEPSYTYFDGLLDELQLFGGALSADQITSIYHSQKPDEEPELPKRVLPSGPLSPGQFRAVNTTLKYYPGWDATWQIGEAADVVVQFDETDCKFVFWHGTSYIPNWVTENGIWFNNAFNEGWNEHGSCEPMSDKKAKYSNVKVLESNDARVVVKWRYGLVDVLGNFAFEDPTTGWGDWTNETYTIYPDMVGVRKDKLLSNAPHAEHEWQESIMVMGPGQSPEDVLEYEALSLANIKGETETYSWEHETPPYLPPSPENPVIQTVNTRSTYHPFSVLRPQDNPRIDVYAGEIRRDVSVFPWWNHWPVAPRPTDGRYAMFADRASHASLSHWIWDAWESDDRSMTKLMLNGLTDKSVDELLPLARSWAYPAAIALEGDRHEARYAPDERAYHIHLQEEVAELAFSLDGSGDSPIVNPAFVLRNWGAGEPVLKVDGKRVDRSSDYRYGFRESLDSRDLIIWLRMEKTEPVSFSLSRDK